MNEGLKKRRHSIGVCFFGLVITVFFAISSILAYAGTVEIVYVTPHYRHPVTGVIEDSGQNEDIGQGMTESVLFPQALLETDDEGRIYLTTRNKLAQHITSMKFAVQKRGDKGYTPVAYQVTGSGADYKDTRFQIPSKNSIVRMEFYVEPMGRTVIFYASMGKIVPGNTDFKVSVNVTGTANQVANQSGTVNPSQTPPETPNVDADALVDDDGNSLSAGNAQIASQTAGEAGKEIGFDHGLLTRESPEVRRLLGKDNQKEDDDLSKAPYGEVTKFMLTVLAIIIGISVSALIMAAVAMPIYYTVLKNRNDRREMDLYAKEDRIRKKQA